MTINNGSSNKKGFTLLEILITISVFATIAVLIAQVFFTTTHINTKTEVLKEVKQNGDFALDVITRMMRNSIAIQSACDPTGTTLSALDIQNPDGNVTEFMCVNWNDPATGVSATRIASVSAATGDIQYLTSSNVTLGGTSCADSNNSLTFVCMAAPEGADKVTVTFKLAQRGTPASLFEQAQMPFQITVSSRN